MGKRRRNRNRQGGWSWRSDGRLDVYVTVDSESGSRRYRTTKNTEEEADDWVTRVKYEAKRNSFSAVESSGMLFGEYMRRWLDDTVRGAVREITWNSYDRAFRVHVEPTLGRIALGKLSPAHVHSWVQHANGRVGAGHVSNTLGLIKRCLESAVEWEIIPRNPAQRVKSPTYRPPEKTPLALTDMPQFFRAVEGDELELLYVIAGTSGLRISELLALRWEDFDFKAGSLRIDERKVSLPGGVQDFQAPKTKKSNRRVPLGRHALEVARERKKFFLEAKLRVGEGSSDAGREFVFPSPRGGVYSDQTARRRWYRILDGAGLPRIHVHDLRHTAATLFFASKTDFKTVQGILGHSKPSTTMDIYTHDIPEFGVEAVRSLDCLLDSLAKSHK